MISVLPFLRRFTSRTPAVPWEKMSVAELALAARGRDEEGKEAFVEIVRRHQNAVCAVACGITGQISLTDDIAQDTFLYAWKQMTALREPARLKAWLSKIARSTAMEAVRRGQRTDPLGDDVIEIPAPDSAPDAAAADAEDEKLVWDALGELPEKFRLPLVLFYREGQSIADVAATLTLSEDAVKQRLSRGRHELREQVAAKIEGVLSRVRPNPLLVVTVAAAIGVAAAPEAVAAGAVSQSSTTWIAAAAALAICVPLGWSLRPPASSARAVSTAATPPPDPLAEFADSALLREWRRLHEVHGRDAAAMPAIYEAIQELPGDFPRRALRRTLLTEWAGVDAVAGFDFLRAKKQTGHAISLSHEWLRCDPAGAAEWLTLHGATAPEIVRELLADVAEKAPGKLAAVAGALALPDDAGKDEIAAAFTIFAAMNPVAARMAAEAMPDGAQRDSALAGVAGVWAQRDGTAAYVWCQTLTKGAQRDAALHAAITTWAGRDPAAALAHYKEVPRGKNFEERGMEMMKAALARDFDAVIRWAAEHSDQINDSQVWDEFSPVMLARYHAGPAALLQWLAQQPEGLRNGLFSALARGTFGPGADFTDTLWDWLDTLPQNHTVEQLRLSLKFSPRTVAWLKQLPDRWESRSTIARVLTSILRHDGYGAPGESRETTVEKMILEFSPALRPGLYAAALEGKTTWSEAERAKWAERIASTPESGVSGDGGSARAADVVKSLGAIDPEGALEWALSLPEGQARKTAEPVALGTWAAVDAAAASSWVNGLPPGGERDRCAEVLVRVIATEEPDAAWAWANSITAGGNRQSAHRTILSTLHQQKNPERAQQLVAAPEVDAAVRSWYQREYIDPPESESEDKPADKK